MSLLNKLKETGKRTVLAGTLAGVLAVSGCLGCRDSNYDSPVLDNTVSTGVYSQVDEGKAEGKKKQGYSSEDFKKRTQEYSFEDFKKVLGKERPIKDEKLLRDCFESDSEIDIFFSKMLVDIYTNPEKVKEKMSEDGKKDYANFIADKEQLKKFWSLPENSELSESDKLMLFFIDSMETESFLFGPDVFSHRFNILEKDN